MSGGPAEVTVNGTFQPTGRDSSDWYFIVEGANNGIYARWGVAEFDTIGLFSGNILGITGFDLILTLALSNAYFTKDGDGAFFIAEDTTTNIGPDQGCRRGRY